jgi:hypothetical protein
MKRRADWIAVASLATVAAVYLGLLVRASHDNAVRAYDIYSFFYPIMVQTSRAVRAGGTGLFWNPFQNCGQPLYGVGTTGILYPPGPLSLILPPDLALLGVLLFNLVVGSVAAYFLCREFGVGVLAAWCGALAFGLGNTSTDLITFTPLVSGPWAWLPAAMLFCERILRQPTVRRAVALGVVIGLALVPGHPQAVMYLYQMIALRVAWEFVTRRQAIRGRTLAMLAVGLTLPPLLVAVQLVPALEVMRLSVRNVALKAGEIRPGGDLTWYGLRFQYMLRRDFDNPFILVPFLLGSLACVKADLRRYALFYGVIGVVCVDLALGSNSYLFRIYTRLPFGALFRNPGRFLWLTAFCLSLLVAFGVEAVVSANGTVAAWGRRVAVVLLPALAAAGMYFLAPPGLTRPEWVLVAAVVAACLLAPAVPRLRLLAGGVLAAALLLDLVVVRPIPFRHLLPSGDVLFARSELFTSVRKAMTAQDRAYVVPPQAEYSFEQKTGALFGVPTIFDYEAQPTKRYAEFFTLLRAGRLMTSLNNWLYPTEGFLSAGLNRRLLDLTAARYLIVDKSLDRTAAVFTDPPLTLLPSLGDTRVYENTTAMPRAFYVPQLAVIPNPTTLLLQLALGADDLRQLAFVEAAPADGFLGGAATADGSAEFVRDDPEHTVLRVDAPQRGFVFLADQDFPGWSATVNGQPAPIMRANYAFRVVPVPAGESVVEFRYAPMSVRIGALISAVTWLAVGIVLLAARRSTRAARPLPPS